MGIAWADDATTQPATLDDTFSKHHHIPVPFGLLPDLTDDQKAQIEQIHKKELEQERLLKAQERDSIMALLSDDQKKELEELIGKASLEKKSVADQKEESGDLGAATEPSGAQ
jgi:Spy/CpxP family protein refolding chaperone